MIGMFQSLDLFVLSCLFLTTEVLTGQVLPPENVSLLWITDFQPQLSWTPPQHSMENCKYKVTSRTNRPDSKNEDYKEYPPWSDCKVMEGGFLYLSIITVCNERSRELVVNDTIYPELVKNLQCYINSYEQVHCSWFPVRHTPDLRFFYGLTEDRSGSCPMDLQECPSYNTDGTSCDLRATRTQEVYILFNATLNDALVRNTFRKELRRNMRPSPLEWTVNKTVDKFLISWIPPYPADLSNWKFTISYTECAKEKKKVVTGQTSTELLLLSHCPYHMAMKAKRDITGEETESKELHFDAEPYVNPMVLAAIIIPLLFAGLAVLTFVCCRKNKNNIFPKVPQPRDLLSDISDNNNKKLYVPAEEEDSCKITLVIDPQINKLDS